jgi:phosphoribosylformylglycinamidine (FGAM) synthase-like enzyme
LDAFRKTLRGLACAAVGVVVDEPRVTIDAAAQTVVDLKLDQILKAWNSLEAAR